MSGPTVQHAAMHAMIELLAREKDGQVRLAVLDTLASLGHEASSAVPALIETLRTDVGGRDKKRPIRIIVPHSHWQPLANRPSRACAAC